MVIPPRGLLHLSRGCGPHVRTSSRDVITLIFCVALVKYKCKMTGNLKSTRQYAISSQRGALSGQVKREGRKNEYPQKQHILAFPITITVSTRGLAHASTSVSLTMRIDRPHFQQTLFASPRLHCPSHSAHAKVIA
jgi:hypothetical protein